MIALVLALVGPWGLGHFHVGWRWRAVGWLGGTLGATTALALAVPFVGRHAGWTVALVGPVAAMGLGWVASILDLALRARPAGHAPVWQTALFFVVGLAAPIGMSALVRASLEAFLVPTASMEPSLLPGDRIFAGRARPPRYGDMVVLASPDHPEQTLVKRVVALPGDVLEMRDGRPYVNGWRVPSCPLGRVELTGVVGELEVEFLGAASYLVFYDGTRPPRHAGPLYAAAGSVLVLGDNRNDSADSRSWHRGLDGNVKTQALVGDALVVWWRSSSLDDRHVGIDLTEVTLPSALAPTRLALRGCLAARPPAVPPPSYLPPS